MVRAVPIEEYAEFLPPARRAASGSPESHWWEWRDHAVHLLRAPNSEAGVRVVLVHGAGGHGGALWPVAAQLVPLGLDVTAVDLPSYGRTRSAHPRRVGYDDWIELLVDFVTAHDDGRPLVLLGASVGGLLAVEVAARSGAVAAVAATCLLDPLDRESRLRMTRWGRAGLAMMPLVRLVRGPLRRIPIRISWVADLARMGRDRALGRLCADDSRGGGATVPLGLLASYLQHPHAVARAHVVPVTLVHPEKDDWTPPELSIRTLQTLPGPTETVILRDSGHFPVEEHGLADLEDAVRAMVARLAPRR